MSLYIHMMGHEVQTKNVHIVICMYVSMLIGGLVFFFRTLLESAQEIFSSGDANMVVILLFPFSTVPP
jgi:hypothetical protein